MDYLYRKNTKNGLLCSLLLPLSLLAFVVKEDPGIHLFLLCSCLCSTLFYFASEYCDCQIKSYIFLSKYRLKDLLFAVSLLLLVCYFYPHCILNSSVVCVIVCYHCHLVKSLLTCCPGSFTLGEVQIIVQSIVMFLVCCICTFSSKLDVPEEFPIIQEIPEYIIFLQVLISGSLVLIHVLHAFSHLRQGSYLYFCCVVFGLAMMYSWKTTLKKCVFGWLLYFCIRNKERISLLLFWSLLTLACIVLVMVVNKGSNKKASTITRKYFHLIINAVYIPGLIYDLELLRLASGIGFTVCIVLEMFRIIKVPIIGPAIENAFQVFLDEKDSGVLILAHIYLLVGCSAPIWLSGYNLGRNELHISLFSGIISVGFGDTAAAIGGTLFGKHQWKGSMKTYEGSICAFLVQLVVSLLVLSFAHDFSIINVLIIVVAVFLTTILEGKTTQVDNLVLPLFMFSFFSWIK